MWLFRKNIIEQRANINFSFKLGEKFAETYELLKEVYGDDCMSRTQVYTWFTRFKNGRDDLNDDYSKDLEDQKHQIVLS